MGVNAMKHAVLMRYYLRHVQLCAYSGFDSLILSDFGLKIFSTTGISLMHDHVNLTA